jgi:two-component system, OmpR family, sensor kinase
VSIRLRLVAWYGALFALILVGVALLSYAFHARSHYDDFDRALVTSANHAAAEAADAMNAPHLVEGSGGFDVVLRLYTPNGILQETSSSPDQLPLINPRALLAGSSPPAFDRLAALVPPLVAPPLSSAEGAFGLLTAGGQRWRTYVQPFYRDDQPLGYIEALMPLGEMDQLLMLGATGLLIAVVGSGIVAGQALRPITRMVETAHIITGSRDFSRRIALPPYRDELGHLAHTFNGMLGSLEAAYRAQQQFVADASHELRAPLTAIQGNLELIRRHPAMSEHDRAEALAEAAREADRLSRLVADLLALARADAGVSIKRRPVDLDTVALDAFQTARQLARGQTLTLDPFEPVQVIGDADRLKQLILILLDNALKYTADTDCVRLGLQHTEAGVEIVVQDTGVGIAPSDLPRVFERFYRADPARGRDPGGTGLGLPIARWIVEQHGGTITIGSDVGHGTIVRASLPGSASVLARLFSGDSDMTQRRLSNAPNTQL